MNFISETTDFILVYRRNKQKLPLQCSPEAPSTSTPPPQNKTKKEKKKRWDFWWFELLKEEEQSKNTSSGFKSWQFRIGINVHWSASEGIRSFLMFVDFWPQDTHTHTQNRIKFSAVYVSGIMCSLRTPRPICRSTSRPTYRSICRPMLDRYIGRHIDRLSVEVSIEICRSTCRPTYRPISRPMCRSLCWPTHLDRHIGQVSVHMSIDRLPTFRRYLTATCVLVT